MCAGSGFMFCSAFTYYCGDSFLQFVRGVRLRCGILGSSFHVKRIPRHAANSSVFSSNLQKEFYTQRRSFAACGKNYCLC